MITLACTSCLRITEIEDSLAGTLVRCPICQHQTMVPAEAMTLPPAAPILALPNSDDCAATMEPTLPQVTPSKLPAVGAHVDGRAPVGYEIEKELGRGGMGVVYLARSLALNRACALKMILSGAHSSSEEVARFKTEAQAITRLQHPAPARGSTVSIS